MKNLFLIFFLKSIFFTTITTPSDNDSTEEYMPQQIYKDTVVYNNYSQYLFSTAVYNQFDDFHKFYINILNTNFCIKNELGSFLSAEGNNFELKCSNFYDMEAIFYYQLELYRLSEYEILNMKTDYQICGFTNLLGTCYANTSLQIIFAIPNFISFLTETSDYKKQRFFSALVEVAEEYINKKNHEIELTNFLNCSNKKIRGIFAKNIGEDTLDFILLIIKNIYKVKFCSNKSKKYVKDTFFISYKEIFKCIICKRQKTYYYYNFSILVNKKTIEHGLNTIFENIVVEKTCENCFLSMDLVIKKIIKFSNVLTVNIYDRNDDKIYDNYNKKLEENIHIGGKIYKLFAYIITLIATIGANHCICVIKKNNEWFLLDDHIIIRVQDYLNPPIYPYALFYLKV